MSTISGAVSDMLMTVKSREVQRGMLAEMRGDRPSAARHFLAAAHLELVLAADFEEIGDAELAVRSRLSAASCFWRAGDPLSARGLIETLLEVAPGACGDHPGSPGRSRAKRPCVNECGCWQDGHLGRGNRCRFFFRPGKKNRHQFSPDLTAREAFVFFRHRRKIQARLRSLLDIGLDYLRLGQPAATLSGGEAQRLKLASFLGGSTAALNRAGDTSHTVFILDEPTAGLHPFDMLRLLDALNALVDRGHSVIVIEHSPEVMICAHWIIDLGPGAGTEGGHIVAQGTPEDVAKSGTLTGQVLARVLAG